MGNACHHSLWITTTTNTEPPKAIPYVPEDLVALRWQDGNIWCQWARFATTRCGSPRPPTLGHHDLALLWCCQPPRWADLEVAVQVEHMPYYRAPSCSIREMKVGEWNAGLVTTLETINRPHSQDAESAFSHQYVLTIVHIGTAFCHKW